MLHFASTVGVLHSLQAGILKLVHHNLLLVLLTAGEWAIEAATGGSFPEDKGLVMKVSHDSCYSKAYEAVV